jgi:hypothetical protein
MTIVQSAPPVEPSQGDTPGVGPPPKPIALQLSSAHVVPSALLHIGELGIPEQLTHGPRSVEELARQTNLDPDALRRVMRMLASNSVFRGSRPRTFGQTPAAAPDICR